MLYFNFVSIHIQSQKAKFENNSTHSLHERVSKKKTCYYELLSNSVRILNRQTGQQWLWFSHLTMHCQWKMWEQGMHVTLDSTGKSSKQMVQVSVELELGLTSFKATMADWAAGVKVWSSPSNSKLKMCVVTLFKSTSINKFTAFGKYLK